MAPCCCNATRTSSFLHPQPPAQCLQSRASQATSHNRRRVCAAPDVFTCAAPQALQLLLRLLAGLAGHQGAEQQPPAGDAFQSALLAVACQLVATVHGVVSLWSLGLGFC